MIFVICFMVVEKSDRALQLVLVGFHSSDTRRTITRGRACAIHNRNDRYLFS